MPARAGMIKYFLGEKLSGTTGIYGMVSGRSLGKESRKIRAQAHCFAEMGKSPSSAICLKNTVIAKYRVLPCDMNSRQR
jgi:hypothetical protein